jgi:hypothetical protein
MIISLFVFAFAFLGFGLYAILKKKKFLGVLFALLGIMLLSIAIITVLFYPHTLPFQF